MKEKVLCLIRETWFEPDEQELWMDINPYPRRVQYVLPLYNHPHNDIENGQKEVHYHQDTRYKGDPEHLFMSFRNSRITLPLKDGEYLEYRMLKKIRDVEIKATSTRYISKSKFKHKCIHKGKCPHRGYDLSSEKPVDGIITCPLHSLKFKADTGQLIS